MFCCEYCEIFNTVLRNICKRLLFKFFNGSLFYGPKGLRFRVTGLVFDFNSASLVLKQVPICIRKPKTNTFDKSVVLDGFRSFKLVPHFNKYHFRTRYVMNLVQQCLTRKIYGLHICTHGVNILTSVLKNQVFSGSFLFLPGETINLLSIPYIRMNCGNFLTHFQIFLKTNLGASDITCTKVYK